MDHSHANPIWPVGTFNYLCTVNAAWPEHVKDSAVCMVHGTVKKIAPQYKTVAFDIRAMHI
jgi:hypothetical protein